MRFKAFFFSAAALVSATAIPTAKADIIPYPYGSYNATTYTFTATTTGEIDAYFAGSGASYDNELGLLVDGVSTNVFGLDDHTSSIGQKLNLGSANAGQALIFVLVNSTLGANAYSDPTMNTSYDAGPADGTVDGHNHVYSTAYTATDPILSGVPVGTFVAFEDLPFPGADYNYNDETFVFTNVSVSSSVPELSTWAMMLVGVVGVGFAGYRRSAKASSELRTA